MKGLAKEFFGVMMVNKKLWLAPLITAIVMLGLLVVLTQDSADAPFVYTLF